MLMCRSCSVVVRNVTSNEMKYTYMREWIILYTKLEQCGSQSYSVTKNSIWYLKYTGKAIYNGAYGIIRFVCFYFKQWIFQANSLIWAWKCSDRIYCHAELTLWKVCPFCTLDMHFIVMVCELMSPGMQPQIPGSVSYDQKVEQCVATQGLPKGSGNYVKYQQMDCFRFL